MTTIRKIKRYGWKPDIPDKRDKMLNMARFAGIELPPYVDLRSHFPPCYDQGNLGSCTANAIAGALEFDQLKQQEQNVARPSRLFIYYNERVIEQTTEFDSGAQIRDGIKSVNSQGAPAESLWPYDISKFTVQPPPNVYIDAQNHEAVEYASVDASDIVNIMTVLASGFPVVFGFTVYDNFESAHFKEDGWYLNLPTDEMTVIGGHAVVCVGYDAATKQCLIRNSWGTTWGINGYFWMPFEYLTDSDLAQDFWVIEKVK